MEQDMAGLPTPIGKQREVLYLPANGHIAVLGTAGSGKTTLAILRSVYLADPSTDHCGRTLLVTFNRALVTYLRYLQPPQLENVVVENYHAFARGYLYCRGKMESNCILSDMDQRERLILLAIKNVQDKYKKHAFFSRPLMLFSEEISWILMHGIASLDEYYETERKGRDKSRITRDFRKPMFEILVEYLTLRVGEGKKYDWDDLALHADIEFKKDTSERLYRHIVIDEGQDFSPEMIRSLSAAIPSDGSLTFFGDVAQQIYGQRMSWRSAGLSIHKVWNFEDNYRNTKEIALLGLAISQMPYFSGVADMVEPKTPGAAGDVPMIVECTNQDKEIALAIKLASRNASNQSVAILFRNRAQEELISNMLPVHAIRIHREMKTWQTGPGIKYGTYHSAKGLEFDMVILPFLSQDNLPDKKSCDALGEEDALTHDGRLLYVAVTRAKTRLVMSYVGERTELLPAIASLYKEEVE